MSERRARIAVFGPNPMLSVTIERRGEGRDDVHCHPAGQGVWLSRMAAELGACPVLCSLIGGETGVVLECLLQGLLGELRLVQSTSSSGSFVTDRRSGEREVLAQTYVEPPSRHEVDELVAATTGAALESDVLAICNPYPGDALPLEVYGDLVANARAAGVRVIADLSSPRIEVAAAAEAELVKLNDWELAAYVKGPVDTWDRLRGAAERLRELGAGSVLVTRAGDPALALIGDEAWELIPPKLQAGSREGCGDTMMGAISAALASGRELPEALVIGAGAGAVNFLHHGLGTGSRREVEELSREVELRPLSPRARREAPDALHAGSRPAPAQRSS
jgi:1-phosphofructokinase